MFHELELAGEGLVKMMAYLKMIQSSAVGRQSLQSLIISKRRGISGGPMMMKILILIVWLLSIQRGRLRFIIVKNYTSPMSVDEECFAARPDIDMQSRLYNNSGDSS